MSGFAPPVVVSNKDTVVDVRARRSSSHHSMDPDSGCKPSEHPFIVNRFLFFSTKKNHAIKSI